MRGLLLATLILCVGCGQATTSPDAVDQAMAKREPHLANSTYLALADESELAEGRAESQKRHASERRIIYEADMEIVVTSFDGIEKEVKALVQSFQGYIASADLGRLQGEQRSGAWVVRIPVDDFDAFLDRVEQLGIPTARTQTAKDVSEEFVDLEARLSNKRKLEVRIQQLLERPDDKIQHVIEVERELGRVREEIERFEGRLRFLSDKTAMTTVTINIREEREYVPPQSPTLANRVKAAWSISLRNVVATRAKHARIPSRSDCTSADPVICLLGLLEGNSIRSPTSESHFGCCLVRSACMRRYPCWGLPFSGRYTVDR